MSFKYFYEIKPDSEAYQDVTEKIENRKRWYDEEITKKICELLGVDNIDKNLGLTPDVLVMTDPPEHLKDQFKKHPTRGGFFEAKKNSRINKEWIQFCKDNNLKTFDAWWLLNIKYGFLGIGKKRFQNINGHYLIESEQEINADFLQQVPESEFLRLFLRLRAEYLEQLEKEEKETVSN